jgi:alkylhydroperoxidase family enzyme
MRQREILALRTAYLAGCGYEWAHHAASGKEVGLSDQEIELLATPAASSSWEESDANLIRAADELVISYFISDELWSDLATRWTGQQLTEVVLTVGHFSMLAMALNAIGVQLEDVGLPERARQEALRELFGHTNLGRRA